MVVILLKKMSDPISYSLLKEVVLNKIIHMRGRLTIILLLTVNVILAQSGKENTREEYISQYKDLAMQEMKRTGIPASITLAQGILESGNGNSRLATKANNHFGIKCHNWTGPSVRHDDDSKNECFRKYKTPEKSYLDHSDFLTGKSRYALLFELQPDDYKGWAKGLKKAGYATSPTYASALVNIIEDSELYKYDELVLAGGNTKQKKQSLESSLLASGRTVQYKNRVKYIVADTGDTYTSIANELFLMSWQLPKYNEMESGVTLKPGDIIYLQPKRNKAASNNRTHMVKEGESLYSISQLYAVKESKLRKRNSLSEGDEPLAGSIIMLRGKVSGQVPTKQSIVNVKPDEEEEEFQVEFDLGG